MTTPSELVFGEHTEIPGTPPEGERLIEAIEGLRQNGVAHVPNTLSPEMTEALILEAEGHAFEDHSGEYGLADQRVENLAIPYPYEGFPTVRGVAMFLNWNVRWFLPELEGSQNYEPTEAKYNRYPPGEVGITAHRDRAVDKFMIAAFTLRGEAEFIVRELPPDGATRDETFAARQEAPVIESWHTCPGDLVLLRAPGFDGLAAGRPLHEVTGGNSGERLSLIFRMIDGQDRADG